MKNFTFSNLLGTVYRKGNVVFSPDGFTLFSPVGNKVTIYDLKNHTSKTVSVDASHNYTSLALSPNGLLLLAATEIGEIHVITLFSNTLLHLLKAKGPVTHMKFSPDGRYFAIARDTKVFVYNSPVKKKTFNAFEMKNVFHDSVSRIHTLDWSFDSKLVAFGGDDMVIRIHSVEKLENFKNSTISGHSGEIIGCYFEESSYDLYTISRNGQLCCWEYTTRIAPNEDEEEKEEDESYIFKKTNRFYFDENGKNSHEKPKVTCCDFNRSTKFLVTGFSNGNFIIHLLPDFTKVHRFNISEHQIASVSINKSSEWIAFGCPTLGQLVIWEWESDTFVLKQQGHSNDMSCFAYSPDGSRLATGGDDSKVKLWNVSSSFCYMTFDHHTSAVTGIIFTQNGRALLSSSLDGTVRACDTLRYRNFRTYTSPRSVQFSCVTTDSSGDLVAAGGQDIFDIYMWEFKTAKLVTILSGHEGPVSGILFSPSSESSLLASISWDKTLRVWEAIESSSNKEIIELPAEGTCLAFSPNGKEVVVGTLDCQISFISTVDSSIRGSIECRNHLGSGRSDTDLITAKKSLQSKSFTSIGYSPDGLFIIAGGHSKTICMYHAQHQLLTGKFEVTKNQSYDAVNEFINHRALTEFGNKNLITDRDGENGDKDRLAMPGAKKGDMAARNFKPEVRVSCICFSPTGRAFGATTNEGLMIFSTDQFATFDPINADESVTHGKVKQEIREGHFDLALMTALRLNKPDAIREAVESTPQTHIVPVCKHIDGKYAAMLLGFVAKEIGTTRHVEFYVDWTNSLMRTHLRGFKSSIDSIRPSMNTLAYNMQELLNPFTKMIYDNTFKLMFMVTSTENKKSELGYIDITEEMMQLEEEEVDERRKKCLPLKSVTKTREWPFGTELGCVTGEDEEEEEWTPPMEYVNQITLPHSKMDTDVVERDGNEVEVPKQAKKQKSSS